MTTGLLIAAFGGPESSAEVLPFLRRVTAGRDVPDERLALVAQQYEAIGGASPLNLLTSQLAQAVRRELSERGHARQVAVGLRHSSPTLRDGLAELRTAGCDRVVAVATSAYSSRPGCGQYRDELAVAWQQVGGQAGGLIKVEPFFAREGFWRPFVDEADTARRSLGGEAYLLATAHSIPSELARQCRYEQQLRETLALVAAQAGFERYGLCYQSRSGRPDQPWLEPDVSEALRELQAAGEQRVVLAPIGFVHDHVEVLFDLDRVAVPLAESLGLEVVRIATPGTDVRFVTLLAALFLEAENQVVEAREVCGWECCASR